MYFTTVLKSLFENAQKAQSDPSADAMVIIGEGKNFSAGFDITEFKKALGGGGTMEPSSVEITTRITQLIEMGPKPSVAAISGKIICTVYNSSRKFCQSLNLIYNLIIQPRRNRG